jgi:hypothetical protein
VATDSIGAPFRSYQVGVQLYTELLNQQRNQSVIQWAQIEEKLSQTSYLKL